MLIYLCDKSSFQFALFGRAGYLFFFLYFIIFSPDTKKICGLFSKLDILICDFEVRNPITKFKRECFFFYFLFRITSLEFINTLCLKLWKSICFLTVKITFF